MSEIKYFKRVVEGKIKELHYQENCGEYLKGKSYPESEDSFLECEFEELELDEWLDEGLFLGIFQKPGLSSS